MVDVLSVNSRSPATEQSVLSEEERERLEKELREKRLDELMALQRHKTQEAEEAETKLGAVRDGDLSVLGSRRDMHDEGDAELTYGDAAKVKRIIAEKHLRDESFVFSFPKDADAGALEAVRTDLKELFPATPTEAFIAHDDNGRKYVAVLGISSEEMDAAYDLKRQRDKAREESTIVTSTIQERVKELGNSGLQEPTQLIATHGGSGGKEATSPTPRTR